MGSVKPNITIKEYQNFVKEVYGLSNDRYFNVQDMLSNVERFVMRGLKGIRKKDKKRTKLNLLIAISWFTSMMNQLHIDIEEELWQRFPSLCSYCGSSPCACKVKKPEKRKEVIIDKNKKPETLEEFQKMFNEIYPASKRTLEHAGVHLAEELGEFSETILSYRGGHRDETFDDVKLEAADLLSCFMSLFNSLDVSIAKELSVMFSNNCHVCHDAPCSCTFEEIIRYKS